ncbi:hypothetical protein V499_09148 [Pseudogymnoascus sp. VKM F-103]|nr:hypothetical protein V499_09148 [Pseudogymnoascus sp. VKM F-103]
MDITSMKSHQPHYRKIPEAETFIRVREADNAAIEENAPVTKGFLNELKVVKEAIDDISGTTDEGLTETEDMRHVVAHYHISLPTSLIPIFAILKNSFLPPSPAPIFHIVEMAQSMNFNDNYAANPVLSPRN